MATYFVDSARADDTGAGTSWATAKKTFSAALAIATTDGDIVKVHYATQEEVASDTTYVCGANIAVIAVDKNSSDVKRAMSTDGWLGNSSTNRTVRIGQSGKSVYFWGMTLRVSGSTGDVINVSSESGQMIFDGGYLWQGNTNNTSHIHLGAESSSNEGSVIVRNTTFRFGSTGQNIAFMGHKGVLENCTISPDGAEITLLVGTGTAGSGPGTLTALNCNFSAMGSSGTLVNRTPLGQKTVHFINCKFPASLSEVVINTVLHGGETEAYIYNCSATDKHYAFEYHNAYGSLITVGQEVGGAIYADDNPTYDGTNKCVWKVVTTAAARFTAPFTTPWMSRYHGAASAITPSLEILRDGSSTAYKDNEVWGEFSYQGTSGFPLGVTVNDRQDVGAWANGTAAADQTSGMGVASWTGDAASAWSGKLHSASTITPAEIGHLMARVHVAAASATVYIDPQIRI